MCPVRWLKNNLNVVLHIPIRVPSYSLCQLYIPGLEGHPPDMNSKQVGILHDANHKHLCSLVKGINCLFANRGGRGLLFPFFSSSLVKMGASTSLPLILSYSRQVISLISLKIYIVIYLTCSTKNTYIYSHLHT